MRTFVKKLKSDYSAPIDGVGLQSHFKINLTTNDFISRIGKTIDDLGESNFIANITELDIRICNGDTQTLEDQKKAYKNIITVLSNEIIVKQFLIWGPSDNDSWINSHFQVSGQATPHDENFNRNQLTLEFKRL